MAGSSSQAQAPPVAEGKGAVAEHKGENGKGFVEPCPYLSFNPSVTPEDRLPAPSAEEAEHLRKMDPKLPHKWAIWEQHVQPKDKKAAYTDSTRQTAVFHTVREFWGCWNHLPQPSVLLQGQKFVRGTGASRTIVDAIMVFREGIPPQWEHSANSKGGHFQIQLKPEVGGGTVDEVWNNIVLGIVGGLIEPADMITGVRLVDRLNHKTKPAIRIELWFNDMDENDTGALFNLKGNFESFIGTALDGERRAVTWAHTEKVSHAPEKEPPTRPSRPSKR